VHNLEGFIKTVVDELESYELICQIAKGGMAEIFLARTRTEPPSLVVIKALPEMYIDNSERMAMFFDETRLAGLLNHPNIVELVEADIFEGMPFLVLEFIDGPCLSDVAELALSRRRPIDPRLTLTIGARVCEALHYAHELTSEVGDPWGSFIET